MKPLIPYYGGKGRMAHKIVPLLPKHTVYVEPFAGGLAVMFAKPVPEVTSNSNYREVINDTSEDLINLYRIATQSRTRGLFLDRVLSTLYSRAEYNKSKAILKNEIESTPLDRAWAYYISVCMSFANKLKGSWGTGIYSRNLAATFKNRIAELDERLDRLRGAHIECDDALKVIERWDSPQTLFYCDPPYPGTDQGHYGGYTTDDFNNLVSLLDRIQGSFVLSNYDQPGVPAHWERFEFSVTASSSGKGQTGAGRDKSRGATASELGDRKRTEIVWRMDRSENARPEIQKIWNKSTDAPRVQTNIAFSEEYRTSGTDDTTEKEGE